ncbi:hypothetical protein V6N13_073733 [Hibiscus sabdariffa]
MSPSRDNIRSMYATSNNPPSTIFKTPDACLVPKKERCLISNKTENLDKIQLARRRKTLSSRGFVRSSDNLLFGHVNPDVLIYSKSLTHQHGFSLFIFGFVNVTIVYGKQNKWYVHGIKIFGLTKVMVGFKASTSFERDGCPFFDRSMCPYMLSVVTFNLEAREAKRNKIFLESYWKNQATRLPWVTAAMKNCFSAMVEGFVLQGSGDKEEWEIPKQYPCKVDFYYF